MRVLVVEDEAAIADFICRGLAEAGYAVDVAEDGDAARAWLAIAPYDLVVLDWMLPGRAGVAMCQEWRALGIRTPILMLTARDTVDDRIAGLDAGVDDYMVKPFAFAELLARLRALLRREPLCHDTVLRVADLVLDPATHAVTRDSTPIVLTSKEFSLLEYLMRNAGRVCSRSTIADHVWSYAFDNVTNVIDVHIVGLRRKIDDPFAHKLIHTIRGVGYMLGGDL